jgi:transposase-like protein
MNLAQITSLTDDQARDYLESIRWPQGAKCPHCGSTNVTKLQGKSTRKGVYKRKPKECRKQFTVTVGTIFERWHIATRRWVIAFHLLCSSKAGFSAHQLHRSLGVTYKTAWFMCHRIRHALANGPFPEKMKGTVEVDETYVGGKPRIKGGKHGRGTTKTPVVARVSRDDTVRAAVVPRLTAKNLRAYIKENIDPSATLMTDEIKSYIKVGREFAAHNRIRHSAGVYSLAGGINTNTVESFFGLIKRGVYGNFHHVSPAHLQRYCDEFTFRWDHREDTDGERRDAALGAVEGQAADVQVAGSARWC